MEMASYLLGNNMYRSVAFMTVQIIYLRVRRVRRGLGTVAGVRYFSSYLNQTGSL